ncbi:uncharacterized protein EV420DRAFT_1759456 [Desarmillaria tabescens]|uniref:Mid2 domain-containing protein n=1 Tax=Armillaria tabescens TaxID=1929756 RepID=A0AA39NIS6_ARMTA|nr:uncharacterized protein EV420DRAFT_1759456 [Desarmillaria tabescens]KAK0466253.1 hypothetical protein EV420DRAFT_1759456 [Desarmillaria tabescens]
MAGYRNITYDDTRFDVLKYAGSWTNNGSYNATSVGETGTLSSTKDPTANVTFIFPESANAFYYYGIPRCCGGLYAICIDCDFDSLNTEPVDAVNRTDDGKNPPVVLYSKTFDTPGVHKITLTNQNDTRFPGGNSQLTLDRFVIQVEDNSSSASISSTSTSGASSFIPATSLIAPEASQSTTTSSPASKPPIGAIVGGVLGGIAAISLCLIIWFFMRRRHHTQHSTQPEHNNTNTSFYTSPNQYSPFIVPRANTQTPTAYTVTDATSEYTSRRTNRASLVGGPSVSDPSSGRIHPSSSRMASSERLPRRETDAGRIDVDDDDDFGTLPPGYEDIFSGGRLNGEQSESVTRGPSRRLPRPEPQRPLPSPSGQPPSQPSKF